ncbi:MAG TPA: alpha-glucuronidase family glycosyl hydrolase [Flavisolibacter sp.]|nr:alpha-glucuronidase family glycosyl hydrolase [Flavisolibacter sp.]
MIVKNLRALYTLCFLFFFVASRAEDGYRLWLRYDKISNASLLYQYRSQISAVSIKNSSPTLTIAKNELLTGLQGLLGKAVAESNGIKNAVSVVVASNNALGKEGFSISNTDKAKRIITITANTDIGALYGVFHFLRLLQTGQSLQNLNITSVPKIQNRILNHWDNLNRHVERGYAGISIWNWHQLPGYIDQRYIDYARANASIGINGTVLTNVNANALVLTKQYLTKVKALADVFRPYGIKVYLTARFSAPIEIGGLKTADPLNDSVRQWWKEKADEIYRIIPDFGGFLVKANSEGQPGPQNYGRTHADGANLLADAVAPHGGLVMWRAFVYSNETPEDRVKQAYNEFKPLDGTFRKNVLVQVKNGPLDFQPREPFSPLFGAMPKTPLMMEFQLTQEYLGQGTHLVYEAPLFKEVLDADTYAKGKGSTVAKIIDGTVDDHAVTGIAGVANIGNERNWTNHPFGQANWYTFGRLAWDHDLSSAQIADEWIKQTFGNKAQLVASIQQLMLASREAVVNYMTPLGLTHIMGTGHHYGPAPWVSNAGRADWNPVYYHRADSFGIGFNRTATGSNALAQYAPPVQAQWKDSNTCDEKYLLWFHHVSWQHKMKSGRTLWNELCAKYQQGVDTVRRMQRQWNGLKNAVDAERFNQVKMFLAVQEHDAVWWRNACLLFFQKFSKMPFPAGYEKPDQTLEEYQALKFPFAPGNG